MGRSSESGPTNLARSDAWDELPGYIEHTGGRGAPVALMSQLGVCSWRVRLRLWRLFALSWQIFVERESR